MANPANTTITIDGTRLNAFLTLIGLCSMTDDAGMPAMGSDRHDPRNVPSTAAKIELWTDDSRTEALCTIANGGSSNHTLSFSVQPALDRKNYHDLQLGN